MRALPAESDRWLEGGGRRTARERGHKKNHNADVDYRAFMLATIRAPSAASSSARWPLNRLAWPTYRPPPAPGVIMTPPPGSAIVAAGPLNDK